jgi:hydrogenase-4 component E
MEFLIILLLLSALLLTRVANLKTAVRILLFQSSAVAAACVVIGVETGLVHTYIAAALTVIIKVAIIPYALFRIVGRIKNENESNPILSANYSLLAAIMAIILSYSQVDRALNGAYNRDALSMALSLTLIGLLLIMTRKQAVMQIVGLNTMENGLYLLGLSITKGLPLIIEFGIFFDVLVAVVILVILTYRLKLSYMSTDTSLLKKLKG